MDHEKMKWEMDLLIRGREDYLGPILILAPITPTFSSFSLPYFVVKGIIAHFTVVFAHSMVIIRGLISSAHKEVTLL